MSMSINGSTVMNVCCHSNGYNSAAIVVMHVLSVLDKYIHQMTLHRTNTRHYASLHLGENITHYSKSVHLHVLNSKTKCSGNEGCQVTCNSQNSLEVKRSTVKVT